MAEFTFTMVVGAVSDTQTILTQDARALEFLDDLRNLHYTDEETTLTRAQAGARYLLDLRKGSIALAKGLKQQRLDNAVAVADDLEGN